MKNKLSFIVFSVLVLTAISWSVSKARITNPGLASTPVSVADGGTGAATFTNNRVLTGNGTSALVDEANLTFDGTTLTVTGNATITSVLTVPAAAAPTVDAAGEIAVDTTSDQLTWYGTAKRVVTGKLYPSFSYATSTAWTGTTTIQLGTAFVAETWNAVQCYTNAGTLNMDFGDGTNYTNMLNASTTIGTFSFSTNNTFTAAEKREVRIGTPATSPVTIACTLDKVITAD